MFLLSNIQPHENNEECNGFTAVLYGNKTLTEIYVQLPTQPRVDYVDAEVEDVDTDCGNVNEIHKQIQLVSKVTLTIDELHEVERLIARAFVEQGIGLSLKSQQKNCDSIWVRPYLD